MTDTRFSFDSALLVPQLTSSLSNPYVTAAAVYGLNIQRIASNKSMLECALDVELMIRGPLGSKSINALQGRELPNDLPYAQLANTLHTGDLLMLWEKHPSASRDVRRRTMSLRSVKHSSSLHCPLSRLSAVHTD